MGRISVGFVVALSGQWGDNCGFCVRALSGQLGRGHMWVFIGALSGTMFGKIFLRQGVEKS